MAAERPSPERGPVERPIREPPVQETDPHPYLGRTFRMEWGTRRASEEWEFTLLEMVRGGGVRVRWRRCAAGGEEYKAVEGRGALRRYLARSEEVLRSSPKVKRFSRSIFKFDPNAAADAILNRGLSSKGDSDADAECVVGLDGQDNLFYSRAQFCNYYHSMDSSAWRTAPKLRVGDKCRVRVRGSWCVGTVTDISIRKERSALIYVRSDDLESRCGLPVLPLSEASGEGKSEQRPGRVRRKERSKREILADFFRCFRYTSDVDAFVSFACGAKPDLTTPQGILDKLTLKCLRSGIRETDSVDRIWAIVQDWRASHADTTRSSKRLRKRAKTEPSG